MLGEASRREKRGCQKPTAGTWEHAYLQPTPSLVGVGRPACGGNTWKESLEQPPEAGTSPPVRRSAPWSAWDRVLRGSGCWAPQRYSSASRGTGLHESAEATTESALRHSPSPVLPSVCLSSVMGGTGRFPRGLCWPPASQVLSPFGNELFSQRSVATPNLYSNKHGFARELASSRRRPPSCPSCCHAPHMSWICPLPWCLFIPVLPALWPRALQTCPAPRTDQQKVRTRVRSPS